MFLFLSLSAC